MADTDNPNQNDNNAPTSIDQVIKQVQASIAKESMNSLKNELTKLFKEKAEAERAVKQIEAKIEDAITKARAGI